MRKQQQRQESEMSKIQSGLSHSENEMIYLKNALAEFKTESSIVEIIESKISTLKDMMSKLDIDLRETMIKKSFWMIFSTK